MLSRVIVGLPPFTLRGLTKFEHGESGAASGGSRGLGFNGAGLKQIKGEYMAHLITLFLFGWFLHENWTPAAGVVTWTITALLLITYIIMAAQGNLIHQRLSKLEEKLKEKSGP